MTTAIANEPQITLSSSPECDVTARVRIVVEEKQGVDQKGLIGCFRSSNYSAASTAKTAYEAEELQPLGAASKGALSGASNGTAVSHTALPTTWTPVVGTNLGGTSFLTHTGTNRVRARLRSVDGTAVSARLVWDVGDLINPTENGAWTFPAGTAFYVADLGEVRLDPAPIGAHRWQGQIQAVGATGGEDIQIDKVWIENSDEGSWALTAPPQSSNVNALVLGWDSFSQTAAGTVTGKVAPLGGTWAGSGDPSDFTVDTANRWIQRTAKEDAGLNGGRFLRLGSGTAKSVEITLDVGLPKPELFEEEGGFLGVIARYTDASNYLAAGYESRSVGGVVNTGLYNVVLWMRLAGVFTQLAISPTVSISEGWRTLVLSVTASGDVAVYDGQQGSSLSRVAFVNNGSLAAGTLSNGGYGIYDVNEEETAATRKYDNFLAKEGVVTDAVLFASQKANLSTEGMYRLDSGGSAYGPISRCIGDLPRLPAGGLENRPTELFLKGSRGDFEDLPDSAIDDLAVKVYAQRSWLTVPGTI